jgi:hypothetical protein
MTMQVWACTNCGTLRQWGDGAPKDSRLNPLLLCKKCKRTHSFFYEGQRPSLFEESPENSGLTEPRTEGRVTPALGAKIVDIPFTPIPRGISAKPISEHRVEGEESSCDDPSHCHNSLCRTSGRCLLNHSPRRGAAKLAKERVWGNDQRKKIN